MGFPLRLLILSASALALYSLVTASSRPANPCGWWGDGEVDLTGREITYGNPEDASPASSYSSAAMTGHGIAIFRPDHAVPYLRAVAGRNISGINRLKPAGFVFVIDLGMPTATAALHRAEAEGAGMGYIGMAVEGETPSAEQVKQFSAAVDDPANRPMVVFAPTSELLGTIWTLHRLGQGELQGTAVGEGRALQ
ncbi:MAG: hypothetical protein A3G18_02080 [Rhodospirillales bacterium RIFCSPLOWO2_12_FULL_58_28]|nr:MAG: hypothetical protein A3H92_07435 [Rhodospirillales bacterium RIFCSPLOWO2_02_FULL_58_16]OHC79076.1 MAG: hypothetical protein A3G18_02080 [Rhodospirillales bacterium RIFCSPLOWO2_12_FULL_58_28]